MLTFRYVFPYLLSKSSRDRMCIRFKDRNDIHKYGINFNYHSIIYDNDETTVIEVFVHSDDPTVRLTVMKTLTRRLAVIGYKPTLQWDNKSKQVI